MGEWLCEYASAAICTHRACYLPAPAAQDQQRIGGALYVLRLLARKYEFRDEEDRAPLEAIVNTTFPVLLPIFKARKRGGSDGFFSGELDAFQSLLVSLAVVMNE